jgi:aldehyde reductase
LWNTFHRPDLCRKGLEKSLTDLQLEYGTHSLAQNIRISPYSAAVDLYLMHYPTAFRPGDELMPKDASGRLVGDDVDYVDTWREMEVRRLE